MGTPEFTFIQVKSNINLTGTLKNSMKVLIMVAKVPVEAVDDNSSCTR